MTFDRARAAVTIAGICAFLDLYAPQAVLPQLSESFHISPASAGTTVGVSTLAVALAAPFAGMLADRAGRKRTIVISAFLLQIPTIMLIFAQGLNEILLWRFIQGLFLPAIFSPMVAYVNEEWPPGKAADVMGLYIAGSALGGFGGRFITALLADHFGWRAGFAVLTLITLACAIAIWAWLPPARHRTKAAVPSETTDGAFAALADHLRNPALLATFAIGFAVLFSQVATFTYVNFHLARAPYSMGTSQLGMIFLVYPIGAAITPASGYLIRRFGRRQAMTLAAVVACGGLAATLHSSLPVIIFGLAMFVTGTFTMMSAAMGFVGQAAERAKATAVGFYVCCYYVGGSVGAVLPGMVVWHAAGWPGCVFLVIAVILAALTLAWRGWQQERRICAAE
ncbi:MFS transporter [Telmatospirillum sp.]|uniref:MFS transporter n=1 Tax=Telmatospirillum sp. TaxID=2079197 RepID=UPI00284E4464|nr:MFS transporter [Telmatospirillum sp.]MDR3437123.1 MFS transporter [Telmatospirillum sp.]